VEVLRFGPGVRRPLDVSGARGLSEQAIWSDANVRVTELAFAPRAILPPRTSPQHGLFIIVSGGGWVQVGDERAAVNHGEAVEWPALVAHGAWTDGTHMRAILVEVREGAPNAWSGHALVTPPDGLPRRTPPVSAGRGRLTERPRRPEEHDPSEGEPW
jgi:quercetin dioxygenase-like cupin family protein